MNATTIGQRLFNLVVDRGWTQSECARYTGIPREVISAYVRGNAIPSGNHVNTLCATFGITPKALMTPEED